MYRVLRRPGQRDCRRVIWAALMMCVHARGRSSSSAPRGCTVETTASRGIDTVRWGCIGGVCAVRYRYPACTAPECESNLVCVVTKIKEQGTSCTRPPRTARGPRRPSFLHSPYLFLVPPLWLHTHTGLLSLLLFHVSQQQYQRCHDNATNRPARGPRGPHAHATIRSCSRLARPRRSSRHDGRGLALQFGRRWHHTPCKAARRIRTTGTPTPRPTPRPIARPFPEDCGLLGGAGGGDGIGDVGGGGSGGGDKTMHVPSSSVARES